MKFIKLVYIILFLSQLFGVSADATEGIKNTEVTTILAMTGNQSITVSANHKQQSTSFGELEFSLSSLPKKIKADVCSVHLTMKMSSKEDTNGTHIQLFLGETTKQLAAITIQPKQKENSRVIFRSKSLCKEINDALSKGQISIRFKLQSTSKSADITFHGLDKSSLSYIPRLILNYERENDYLDSVESGQFRQNAQHNGRSLSKLYDPDGEFSPTDFKLIELKNQEDVVNVIQSPVIYAGKIFVVYGYGNNQYKIVAMDKFAKVIKEISGLKQPKYLLAGADRLFYVTENEIQSYSLAPSDFLGSPEKIIIDVKETLKASPTIGLDGSLFLVTNQYIHAYSPFPKPKEIWHYDHKLTNYVSLVTLKKDGQTAYVFFGDTNSSLKAFDSTTGECIWEHKLDKKITTNENDPMPFPVVVGSNIFFTDQFPVGNGLYVFHDTENDILPDQDQFEVKNPVLDTTCGFTKDQPDFKTKDESQSLSITPVVEGTGNEAFYVKAGQLCWYRDNKESCSQTSDSICKDVLKNISVMLVDSSSGEDPKTNKTNVTHLYGLASTTQTLLLLNLKFQNGSLTFSCPVKKSGELGPNLVLASGGTIFNVNNSKTLQAIIPDKYSVPTDKINLTLDEKMLATKGSLAFSGPPTITTAPGLTLTPGTNLIIRAGNRVNFAPGFKVQTGARLHVSAGF